MGDASRQVHWENVYTTKGENEVSWFQQSPAPSLELIVQAGAVNSSAIIDIGGGASRLVDHLVERGFEDVTVLDLSGAALETAKARLGADADRVPLVGGRCHDLGAGEAIRHLARPGGVPLSHRRERPRRLYRAPHARFESRRTRDHRDFCAGRP